MTEAWVLIPNATCAHCGQPFRMVPHQLVRKKREGKPTLCGQSCSAKYYKFDNSKWLKPYWYTKGNIPWNKGITYKQEAG